MSTLNGVDIPKAESLHVPGLVIHKDGSGVSTLPKLQASLKQVMNLIKRVANRLQGLKEQDTLQILQALVASRKPYGTPYLDLKKDKIEKLNTLLNNQRRSPLGFLRKLRWPAKIN